jgi:hypothetical protein
MQKKQLTCLCKQQLFKLQNLIFLNFANDGLKIDFQFLLHSNEVANVALPLIEVGQGKMSSLIGP